MTKKTDYKKITKKIANLMLDKKAIDIKIIDVKKITTLTDYFIVCTSDSTAQTNIPQLKPIKIPPTIDNLFSSKGRNRVFSFFTYRSIVSQA